MTCLKNQREWIESITAAEFYISERFDHRGDDHPYLPFQYQYSQSRPPPPVSIFIRTLEPPGVVHYNIFPTPVKYRVRAEPGGTYWFWKYLIHECISSGRVHESENAHPHILPGLFRSIVYTVQPEDRTIAPKLVDLRRYFNPLVPPPGYSYPTIDNENEELLGRKRLPKPQRLHSSFQLTPEIHRALSQQGIRSTTYDEGIGRLCVVSGEEQTRIMVLDFAHKAPAGLLYERAKAILGGEGAASMG